MDWQRVVESSVFREQLAALQEEVAGALSRANHPGRDASASSALEANGR